MTRDHQKHFCDACGEPLVGDEPCDVCAGRQHRAENGMDDFADQLIENFLSDQRLALECERRWRERAARI